MTDIIILNSTSTYLHLGSYLTILGLRKLINSLDARIIFEHEVNNKDFSDVLKLYNNSENPLIIVNGEGTFHDDQDFACSLLDFIDINKLNFMILNSQFRNMSEKYIEIIKKAKVLQVRTKKDYYYCEGKQVDNLLYCPDMLFFSGIMSSKKEDSNLDEIILTDSHVQKASLSIIHFFLKNKNYKKRWVNIHFRETSNLDIYQRFKLSLFNFLNRFITRLNTKTQLSLLNNLNKTSFSKTLFFFINSKLIITGRYHGACLAILLNKPLLYTYSNTTKIENLCNDFNWGMELNEDNIKKLLTYSFKQNLDEIHKKNIETMNKHYDRLKLILKEKISK